MINRHPVHVFLQGCLFGVRSHCESLRPALFGKGPRCRREGCTQATKAGPMPARLERDVMPKSHFGDCTGTLPQTSAVQTAAKSLFHRVYDTMSHYSWASTTDSESQRSLLSCMGRFLCQAPNGCTIRSPPTRMLRSASNAEEHPEGLCQ